jgi:hypothetical protein
MGSKGNYSTALSPCPGCGTPRQSSTPISKNVLLQPIVGAMASADCSSRGTLQSAGLGELCLSFSERAPHRPCSLARGLLQGST